MEPVMLAVGQFYA